MCLTGQEIASTLGDALATVSAVLCRHGLGKRSALEPVNRYERRRPDELVHADVKKLGRIQGGAGKRVMVVASSGPRDKPTARPSASSRR